MSKHPIIDLANGREVRQAKGFRKAASELDGPGLEPLYEAERVGAPRKHAAGKLYFAKHTGRLPKQRLNGKDPEHLGLALLNYAKTAGEPLRLASGEEIQPLDYGVTLQTAAPDKGDPDDPNQGVGKVDLLGITGDERLSIFVIKYLAPEATRGGTGDTPLRALLEGLSAAAILDVNASDLRGEIQEKVDRKLSEEAPQLVLLGAPRYWELCRRREAQKGAGWIRELERLGREIGEHIGVEVVFAAVELEGDPGWEYRDNNPWLTAPPRFKPAWEAGAGKLKPKPKPRTDPADALVEPDLSKPPRPYKITESYEPGDRIEHPTLGDGVVQGVAGRGKISVLFDERKSLLVHERPGSPG